MSEESLAIVQQLERSLPQLPNAIAEKAMLLAAEAKSITIASPADIYKGKELLAEVRRAKKSIDAFFAAPKRTINQIKESLMARIKYYIEPLEEADKTLQAQILAAEKSLRATSAKQTQEDAMPWEQAQAAAVVMPEHPAAKTTKLPPAAEVYDKVAFLKAALEPGREDMLRFILIDQAALNAEAKRLGSVIEHLYPGVRLVERETIRIR